MLTKNEELENKLVQQKKIIDFYQGLTSTKIIADSSSTKTEEKYNLVTMNRDTKQGIRYSLTHATSEKEFVFKCTANAKYLPTFLQGDEVRFDEGEIKFLLKNIYNTKMFKEDDEE